MKISFLLAKQRSGTQLFRSILSSHPDLIAVGEVFRADFLQFWYEQSVGDTNILFPNPENVQSIVTSFCEARREGKEQIMLDVKYNQAHALNLFYQRLRGQPYLFDFIRENKYPVIHLVRENVLETVLSILYARKTGVYKAKNANEVPKEKILEVNINQCQKLLKTIDNEINYVRNTIGRYEGYTEVFYHDILDAVTGGPKEATFEKVAGHLALTPEFEKEIKLMKLAKPMNEMVTNYDDLCAALKDSKFEGYLL